MNAAATRSTTSPRCPPTRCATATRTTPATVRPQSNQACRASEIEWLMSTGRPSRRPMTPSPDVGETASRLCRACRAERGFRRHETGQGEPAGRPRRGGAASGLEGGFGGGAHHGAGSFHAGPQGELASALVDEHARARPPWRSRARRPPPAARSVAGGRRGRRRSGRRGAGRDRTPGRPARPCRVAWRAPRGRRGARPPGRRRGPDARRQRGRRLGGVRGPVDDHYLAAAGPGQRQHHRSGRAAGAEHHDGQSARARCRGPDAARPGSRRRRWSRPTRRPRRSGRRRCSPPRAPATVGERSSTSPATSRSCGAW